MCSEFGQTIGRQIEMACSRQRFHGDYLGFLLEHAFRKTRCVLVGEGQRTFGIGIERRLRSLEQ